MRLPSSRYHTIPHATSHWFSQEESIPTTSSDRGRGRGLDRGRGRGRGRGGEGRGGAPPRPPPVEMTASGPFAMGPALAGMAGRRGAPRSNFAPVMPQAPAGGRANLGAGLTQTTAPSLKKEKERAEPEEEAYSDPDDGVEIVDMENVRQMDWMAPESLRKERESGKKKGLKVKKEEDDARVDLKQTGRQEWERLRIVAEALTNDQIPVPGDAMDVDRQEPEEEVNMANAVDLSESEEEEELEDIIDDFALTQQQQPEEVRAYIHPALVVSYRVFFRIRIFDKNASTSSSFPNLSRCSSRDIPNKAPMSKARVRPSPVPAKIPPRKLPSPTTQSHRQLQLEPLPKRLKSRPKSTASLVSWRSTRVAQSRCACPMALYSTYVFLFILFV